VFVDALDLAESGAMADTPELTQSQAGVRSPLVSLHPLRCGDAVRRF
jgi:hypothetical protein